MGAFLARPVPGIHEPGGSALVDMKGLKIAVTVNAAHADKWLAGFRPYDRRTAGVGRRWQAAAALSADTVAQSEGEGGAPAGGIAKRRGVAVQGPIRPEERVRRCSRLIWIISASAKPSTVTDLQRRAGRRIRRRILAGYRSEPARDECHRHEALAAACRRHR